MTESVRSNGVALGDLDGDGVLDLVTAGYDGGVDGYATTRLGSTRSGVAPLLNFSLQTMSDARWAFSLMTQKLDHLSTQRGSVGAFQSRVSSAISTLGSAIENSAAAESRIRDIDIGADSAELVRIQILEQAAAAVLSQANQQPALALQLLGG